MPPDQDWESCYDLVSMSPRNNPLKHVNLSNQGGSHADADVLSSTYKYVDGYNATTGWQHFANIEIKNCAACPYYLPT